MRTWDIYLAKETHENPITVSVKWGDSPAITVLRTQLKHHKPSTVNLQPNSCRSSLYGNKSNTLGSSKLQTHWSSLFGNKSNTLGSSKYTTLYGNKSNTGLFQIYKTHWSFLFGNKSNTGLFQKYKTHWSFLFWNKSNTGLFQIYNS